jgi:signal transduction histidine kinase
MGHASVDRILRNIENDFKFVMREKNIKFTITAEPNLELISDEARISQVLAALLYNSVDFVPKETGVIEVSAQSKGDDILFCVKDNGPGIPEHKKKFLFQKFYQVDTSLKRKHGGTGLGLAISKGIVTGLGGKIWVETKEGIGSSFYFSLPKGEGSKK